MNLAYLPSLDIISAAVSVYLDRALPLVAPYRSAMYLIMPLSCLALDRNFHLAMSIRGFITELACVENIPFRRIATIYPERPKVSLCAAGYGALPFKQGWSGHLVSM